MNLKRLLCLFLFPAFLIAQQPQSSTAPSFAANAKYTNGVAPGYRPTSGSGLTLNVGAGTAFCNSSIITYAGGTLTMSASQTNYVYLDTGNSCAPASNTTGFTYQTIPIAVVVTGTSTITTITDDRSLFEFDAAGIQISSSSLTVGKVYAITNSAGTMALSLADASSSSLATSPAACIAISTTVCALATTYTFGSSQSWTPGQVLYVSDTATGSIITSAPSTTGHCIQRIGIAMSNAMLLFLPSPDVGCL